MNKNNKIKNKINKLLCNIGLHCWITKAKGKKSNKVILIQKCKHCGLDRQK